VTVKDNFKTQAVIPHVGLLLDTSQSFALYLPKKYNDTAHLPVIIFFDPHGDGTVPLTLYSGLAEKYGYILIGSNSSKNLVSFDDTKVFATNLINEAMNRLHANSSKISLCGFSGGAKVALLSGSENPAIKTIIYTGSKVDITPNHPVTLLGFAGIKDMNYTDLVTFDWSLNSTPIRHYMEEWKGKHEFPTADVFKDAFTLLESDTIYDYNKKLPSIARDKILEEQSIKQDYVSDFYHKDISWWRNEIDRLNTRKANDMMYERLLGFISLACYSISNSAMRDHNLEIAGKILAIYKMADPDNKDCAELYKQYYQMGGR
ncbi:MAG TPA: hypothetical protein VG603_07900, partial [Chitinophagales bacterium]|nr:hypothetical protein [Chitinophagales bacterium]